MKSSVSKKIFAACGSLLAGNTQAATVSDWEVQPGFLMYSETGRVSVTAPMVFFKGAVSERSRVTGDIIFDSITGATPTGQAILGHASVPTVLTPTPGVSTPAPAVVAPSYTPPVTVTSPSRALKPQRSTIPTMQKSALAASPAGVLPTAKINDQRSALSLSYEYDVTDRGRLNAGFSYSTESDYVSTGGSLSWLQDFNQRNTTVTTSVGYTSDTITPNAIDGITGIPRPMTNVGTATGQRSDNKNTVDTLIGVTQVLSKNDLLQVNLGYSNSEGYQNDPYKRISIVDNFGEIAAVYEKRPRSRSRNTVYAKLIHNFSSNILRLSYRGYSDNWDIGSDTVSAELRLPFQFGGVQAYIQPRVRFYRQTRASFYQPYLDNSLPIPDLASSDRRLADITSFTGGVEFGADVGKNSSFSVRVDRMVQNGTANPGTVPAAYAGVDQIPQLTAWSAVISYTSRF